MIYQRLTQLLLRVHWVLNNNIEELRTKEARSNIATTNAQRGTFFFLLFFFILFYLKLLLNTPQRTILTLHGIA